VPKESEVQVYPKVLRKIRKRIFSSKDVARRLLPICVRAAIFCLINFLQPPAFWPGLLLMKPIWSVLFLMFVTQNTHNILMRTCAYVTLCHLTDDRSHISSIT
jgi:hypothetical protein